MPRRFKQINVILILVLLLSSVGAGVAFAEGCPSGGNIYYSSNGDDQTGLGSQEQPFKTLDKAMDTSTSCTGTVTIYEIVDNTVQRRYRFVNVAPPGTGLPLSEGWLIGGLALLAVLSISGALILRRRTKVSSPVDTVHA